MPKKNIKKKAHFTFDRLALTMYDGRHNTVGRRVRLHHFELHRSHATADHEGVVTVYGPVRLHEVRLEVDFE